MKERPILFSGAMVRAILAGQKTQTRRVVKRMWGAPHAQAWSHEGANFGYADMDGWHGCPPPTCPYGEPGDRLWVREAWAPLTAGYAYAADPIYTENAPPWKWRPSIHMPRRASRITLEVVATRVEQLQALTERDAVAEGMHPQRGIRGDDDIAVALIQDEFDRRAGRLGATPAPIARFVLLWDSINAKYGAAWETCPWVWVVEFRRVR